MLATGVSARSPGCSWRSLRGAQGPWAVQGGAAGKRSKRTLYGAEPPRHGVGHRRAVTAPTATVPELASHGWSGWPAGEGAEVAGRLEVAGHVEVGRRDEGAQPGQGQHRCVDIRLVLPVGNVDAPAAAPYSAVLVFASIDLDAHVDERTTVFAVRGLSIYSDFALTILRSLVTDSEYRQSEVDDLRRTYEKARAGARRPRVESPRPAARRHLPGA